MADKKQNNRRNNRMNNNGDEDFNPKFRKWERKFVHYAVTKNSF